MNVIFVIKNILKKDIRVRDHCHITGKYRGSATTTTTTTTIYSIETNVYKLCYPQLAELF